MKNIKLFFLFASLLLAWGCEDAINVDPADEIVESNAITNVSEAGEAVIGVYATLTKTSAIYWSTLFTDELVIAQGNNGQGIQTHTWSITTGNGEAAGIYSGYSSTINRANRVLSAIEGITAENEEEAALLDRYKGELLAIRAWAHFSMAVYFTPDLNDPSSLSVPYVDYVVTLETPNRNTWAEVQAGIQADLDAAEGLIPNAYDQVYFFTVDAITALRARLALYTGDYDTAITHSSQLIGKYSLPSREEYPLIWTDELIEGQILKLARVTGDGAIGQLFNPSPALTYFNPSEKILAAYMDGDIREEVFFDERNRIMKYPGSIAEIGLNDIKVFRISEQYLIRAEAYLRKSSPNVDAAQEDFNTLRANRIEDYVDVDFTTSADALAKVMEERFRELAYEGHRFLDLKRTGQAVDRWDEDCESLAADACLLPATSYLWALPIPQSEIFVNSEMVQNPGYN